MSITWDVATIQRNRKMLKVKYGHLMWCPESVQIMMDALTKQSGYDEEQTALAIDAHFKKRKL